MKKFMLVLMVLMLALALVACGGETDTEAGTDAETNAPDTQPEVTEPEVTEPEVTEHVHVTEEQITPATCSKRGVKKIVCTECGEEVDSSALPKIDHVPVAAATCTEDSVCSACNEVITAKLGHSYGDPIVTSATCLAEGKSIKICATCQDQQEQILPIADHVLPDDAEVVEATCKAAGSKKGLCSTCNTEVTVEIPQLAHTYEHGSWDMAVAGSYSSACTLCGDVATYKNDKAIITLNFDKADLATEVAGFEGFSTTGSSSKLGTEGDKTYMVANGPVWVNMPSAPFMGLDFYTVSFDFMTTATGSAGQYESIFSFVPGTKDGTQVVVGADGKKIVGWNWIIKYNVDAQRMGTVNGKESTDENSIPAATNTWHKFLAVVDNNSGKASVYLDDIYVGSATAGAIKETSVERYQDVFAFRFFDQKGSKPAFDNFVITALTK